MWIQKLYSQNNIKVINVNSEHLDREIEESLKQDFPILITNIEE